SAARPAVTLLNLRRELRMATRHGFNVFSRGVRRTALSMALSMCFVGAAIADTGGLRITIRGADGPVAGATVRISSPSSLISKTATTGADGTARVTGLDPATNYTVE